MATKRGKSSAAKKATGRKAAPSPAASRTKPQGTASRAAKAAPTEKPAARAPEVAPTKPRPAATGPAPAKAPAPTKVAPVPAAASATPAGPSVLERAEEFRDAVQQSKLTATDPWSYTPKARLWAARAQQIVEELAKGGDSAALESKLAALSAEVGADPEFQEARRRS